jgi:branched-chain amino acid transport system substrate-binding protein
VRNAPPQRRRPAGPARERDAAAAVRRPPSPILAALAPPSLFANHDRQPPPLCYKHTDKKHRARGTRTIDTAGSGWRVLSSARAGGGGWDKHAGREQAMRVIRGFLAAGVAVLIAALAGPANADDTQGITDTTIKIGNLGAFSGDASLFSALNWGAVAYLRYVNDQGGINGRKFDVVTADDSCNEAKGIAAAKKLIYDDKVFMIMGQPCSGVAMAIKPLLMQTGVPWAGTGANIHLTNPVAPSVFQMYYNGNASGTAMGRFAMTKPGVTKIALVQHSNDWAHSYCDPAVAYIKAHGGEVVLDTALERGATDATAQVLKIRASGAQAVMGCVYQPEMVILLRDLHKFGVAVPVMGALGADFEQTVAAVNDPTAVRGLYFMPYEFKSMHGVGPLKKFHDIFVKYLTKDELPKSGEPTNFFYAGAGLAVTTVEAFRRAGPNPTREKWLAALESMKDFDTGLYADPETFSPTDHAGLHLMNAIGLNAEGKETVYKSWGVPAE